MYWGWPQVHLRQASSLFDFGASLTVGDVWPAQTRPIRSDEVSTSSLIKSCGNGERGRPGACCQRKSAGPDRFGRAMIQRLERALALAAYIVLRHGLVYAPYIDRLERELEVARRSSPMDCA